MIDWLRRLAREPAATARPIAPRTISVEGRDLPLVIRRLSHARRMTLRLAPDGSEARVSIPSWGRVGDAVAFARDRADWLGAQLARMPARAAVEAGSTVPYRGEILRVVWQDGAPRRPVLDDGEIVLGGPQEGLQTRLARWLEAEALRVMAGDLAHYCARAGQDAPRLALSRAQRRWGSCAADGSIRMNWRLIMAPDFVRRSVVAHEVAHLTHFDHSPAFHAHLDALYDGRIEDANRWLKREGRGLYRHFG
ncbi:M48 family metallopeptidase [Novosphingobium sp. KCTC 2891]|uniref:M48 family metallopeptidase n=1 Tax=Novosphingobium sp. KCTC 2891 TaxID=2989730 RepID=UPI0022234DBC|nr:SprT family zinc-dependent metalloprotease [Novosphingobium sp. KCTC 2891]MCW1383943.1 M48 family metallopeptidase [Novosphingobium sp. KCTC 2891]